jgi:hypothetical protein
MFKTYQSLDGQTPGRESTRQRPDELLTVQHTPRVFATADVESKTPANLSVYRNRLSYFHILREFAQQAFV